MVFIKWFPHSDIGRAFLISISLFRDKFIVSRWGLRATTSGSIRLIEKTSITITLGVCFFRTSKIAEYVAGNVWLLVPKFKELHFK